MERKNAAIGPKNVEEVTPLGVPKGGRFVPEKEKKQSGIEIPEEGMVPYTAIKKGRFQEGYRKAGGRGP